MVADLAAAIRVPETDATHRAGLIGVVAATAPDGLLSALERRNDFVVHADGQVHERRGFDVRARWLRVGPRAAEPLEVAVRIRAPLDGALDGRLPALQEIGAHEKVQRRVVVACARGDPAGGDAGNASIG